MIIGVGFDLVDIIRIERLIGDTRFLERVFSEEEREYIASQGRGAAQSAAGMFAAKEAAAKALGIAADVYFAKDRTKYDTPQPKEPEASKPEAPKKDNISLKCEECGMFIEDYIAQDGTKTSAFKISHSFL